MSNAPTGFEEDNPFAAPQSFEPAVAPPLATSGHRPGRGVRIDGKYLVGRDPMELVTYCVKCGATTDPENGEGKRYRRRLSWAPPWVYIFALVNLIVLAIVYMITRRQVNVAYSLCGPCRKRRFRLQMINAAFWLGLLTAVIVAILTETPGLMLLALVLLIAGLVMLVVVNGPLRIERHKEGVFSLVGAGTPFMSRFGRAASLDEDDEEEWEDY